jgi:hypothetical protein
VLPPSYHNNYHLWREIRFCSDLRGLIIQGSDGPEPKRKSFIFGGIKYVYPKIDLKYYLSRFPPKKVALILKRRDSVLSGNYNLNYKCFVKREKLNAINFDEFEPRKPRVINAASQDTKIIAGVWFLKYSYAMKFSWSPPHHIWYCSGYKPSVFSDWFVFHTNRLGGVMYCTFFGTDFSKYDVTQGPACIETENETYESLGFTDLPGGSEVLKSKMKSTSYGRGIKFRVKGTRKSGDNDTSSGNSNSTGSTLAYFFLFVLRATAEEFAIAVLGDDNFVILASTLVDRFSVEVIIEKMKSFYAECGFIIKIEWSHDPTSVEFLSCRFYPVGNTYLLGRKPGKVLAKLGYGLATRPRKQTEYYQLFKGTLLSLQSTGAHVPFLRVYISTCLSYLNNVDPLFDGDAVHRSQDDTVVSPTSETYVAFQLLYGFDRHDEELFRQQLKKGIGKYGFSCLLTSDYVESLLKTDQGVVDELPREDGSRTGINDSLNNNVTQF